MLPSLSTLFAVSPSRFVCLLLIGLYQVCSVGSCDAFFGYILQNIFIVWFDIELYVRLIRIVLSVEPCWVDFDVRAACEYEVKNWWTRPFLCQLKISPNFSQSLTYQYSTFFSIFRFSFLCSSLHFIFYFSLFLSSILMSSHSDDNVAPTPGSALAKDKGVGAPHETVTIPEGAPAPSSLLLSEAIK